MQDFERRFAAMARLYGPVPAQAIFQSHVAVVGIGGVGSWVAESFARSGVGRITLVDMDHIAESNINRQIHANSETVGQSKVQAMRERIASINPHCVVQCVDDFVDATNCENLLPTGLDALVCACDDMNAKVALAHWASQHELAFITVGAAGGKVQAHQVNISDLSGVTHDPLLARLRNRLRKEYGAPSAGKKMSIAAVFSPEPVRQPDAACNVEGDGSLNCHGYGSLAAVTGTFGLCASAWVLEQIAAKSSKPSKKTV